MISSGTETLLLLPVSPTRPRVSLDQVMGEVSVSSVGESSMLALTYFLHWKVQAPEFIQLYIWQCVSWFRGDLFIYLFFFSLIVWRRSLCCKQMVGVRGGMLLL